MLKAQKHETLPSSRHTGDLVLRAYSACYLTKVGDSNARPQTFGSVFFMGTKQQNLLWPPANLDSICVCLYLKLLKRGYTLYVTDGRPSLHTAHYTISCAKVENSYVGSRSTKLQTDIQCQRNFAIIFFFFFFFLESFSLFSYSPLQVLFKIREILKSSPVLSPTVISFFSTLHNVHHSFDHLTLL